MKRSPVIAGLIAATLLLAGCSASGQSDQSSLGTVDEAPSVIGGNESGGNGSGGKSGTDTSTTEDRQVITTGTMTITAQHPVDAANEAAQIVESVGGRVDGRTERAPSNSDDGSASLSLRIPADRLTATIDKLKGLGDVVAVSTTASDVTTETQDIDARITVLRASIARLTSWLTTSADVDVLITLETAITERQSELESLEAQQRYLADQVSMSTLWLDLISEADAPEETPDTFWSGLVAGWAAFVGFFSSVLVAIGVLMPWIVLLGLVALVLLYFLKWRKRHPSAAQTVASPPATHTPTDDAPPV